MTPDWAVLQRNTFLPYSCALDKDEGKDTEPDRKKKKKVTLHILCFYCEDKSPTSPSRQSTNSLYLDTPQEPFSLRNHFSSHQCRLQPGPLAVVLIQTTAAHRPTLLQMCAYGLGYRAQRCVRDLNTHNFFFFLEELLGPEPGACAGSPRGCGVDTVHPFLQSFHPCVSAGNPGRLPAVSSVGDVRPRREQRHTVHYISRKARHVGCAHTELKARSAPHVKKKKRGGGGVWVCSSDCFEQWFVEVLTFCYCSRIDSCMEI